MLRIRMILMIVCVLVATGFSSLGAAPASPDKLSLACIVMFEIPDVDQTTAPGVLPPQRFSPSLPRGAGGIGPSFEKLYLDIDFSQGTETLTSTLIRRHG
jgi:hypothetical protein